MKFILAFLTLLHSAIVSADQINVSSPADICMSGVCLFDDIDKYPIIKKRAIPALKFQNNKNQCGGLPLSAKFDGKLVKNGNDLNLFFNEYVASTGVISYRVAGVTYRARNVSADNINSIREDFASKYSNVKPELGGWSDENQKVSLYTNTTMGASFTIQWIPEVKLRDKIYNEIEQTKPGCFLKPKL